MIEYERVSYRNMQHRMGGGVHVVYRLSEPYTYDRGKQTSYLCADYADTSDRGPETMLFPCDEDGNVLDWNDLWCTGGDTASDGSCIAGWCHAQNHEVRE